MNRCHSLLRHLPRLTRRATAAPPVEIAFDRWLDARMPGPSTPGEDIAATSLSDAARAEVEVLSATFRQVDRLDARTIDTEASPARQAQCWEDIMQATLVPTTSANPGFVPAGRPISSPMPHSAGFGEARKRNRTGGFARLSPVLNVAMAALLVIVLGLSAWALMGTRPGGSDDGPGATEIPAGVASLAAQDVPATPIAQNVLPTADECTIQPLTIDQVMQRIKGPFPGNIDNVPVAGASPVIYATPPVIMDGPPQQADLDAIAKTQREFVACSIKGDVLQVWAFYAPESEFWRTFLDRYPRFTDEATVRKDVEAYVAGEPNNFLPGLGWDGVQTVLGAFIPSSLPVVNPDPQASLVQNDMMTAQGRVAYLTVSMLYYDPGNPEAQPRYTPLSEMYRVWVYRWDEESKTWMILLVGLDVSRG